MTTDSGLARSGPVLSRRGPAVRPEIAIVYGLLLLLLVWGSVRYTAFRTTGNYTNILEQSIVLGLVAIGQTGVLISGGLDMSVSAIAKVTVLVGAILMNGNNGNIWWVALLLCLMGAAFGALNGVTIVWLRAAPFIVTFASYFLFLGVAYSISTEPVGLTPPAMVNFYGKKWLSIPVPVVMMALVWLLAWAVLRTSKLSGATCTPLAAARRLRRWPEFAPTACRSSPTSLAVSLPCSPACSSCASAGSATPRRAPTCSSCRSPPRLSAA